MGVQLAAATGPSPLWYLTRGTGLVALILLTASVAMGVVTTSRWQGRGWPRFASLHLHRNISLLVVALLAIHIVTAELDTFAPVGWLAVVLPFASSYRPVWLGLGTLAFDLLLALTVTSLLRTRLGYRTWRAVHWLAYASWPVALAHGLGTGTDARIGWVQDIYFICLGAVLAAVIWRLAQGWPSAAAGRVWGGLAAVIAVAVLSGWAYTGPLQTGWAKRAGTPSRLLATPPSSASVAHSSIPGPSSTAPGETNGVPALPFTGTLSGSVTQTTPDSSGQVAITISTAVAGSMKGSLVIVLRGQVSGSGVSLATSSVDFGPSSAPGEFRGQVLDLEGDQLIASVRAHAGTRVELGVMLQIDPTTGAVRGDLTARAGSSSPLNEPVGGGGGDR
jgi:Ferric reductase like transmembrane component